MPLVRGEKDITQLGLYKRRNPQSQSFDSRHKETVSQSRRNHLRFNTEQAVGWWSLRAETFYFIAQLWGTKPMKRIPFPRRPITHNLNDRILLKLRNLTACSAGIHPPSWLPHRLKGRGDPEARLLIRSTREGPEVLALFVMGRVGTWGGRMG